MRIIHTSDWHLGQHFMGKTRQAEHQAFFTWLIEQTLQHAVDAVIVVGDLFDTAAPPSYARELYNNFIVALRKTGATLIILGGNHDSVATLSESRALLACLNTYVIAGVNDPAGAQVLTLNLKNGQPGALLCAVPYIRPRDVLQSQAGQSADEKQLSLQQAIQDHYRTLFSQADNLRQSLGPLPIIATGHLTTVGASVSDSVREIYVGSLEAFPTDAFPAADYIALGHIHRPQKVGGHEHIRYCGSPLPLSFDEARQQKEILIVDFTPTGLQQVTPLPIPCFQPLLTVHGTLDTLPPQIEAAALQGNAARPVWLEITVCADGYISDLQSPIGKMVGNLPVEVLRIKRERTLDTTALKRQAQETLTELTPTDVFNFRLAAENLDTNQQERLRTCYRQMVQNIVEGNA